MKALHDYRLRLFIITLLVIAGGIALKKVIYYGLNHSTHGYEKLTELFRSHTDYDILMLGSSRMYCHLNPAIIDSITGYKSYNAGTDAANIMEIKMGFDAYLRAHPKPKLLILNLDYFSLDIHGQYIGFYSKYLAFKDIPEVGDLLRKNKVRVGLYKIIPFLETIEIDDYNRGAILKVAMHRHKLPPDNFYYKGFESNGVGMMHMAEIHCTDAHSSSMEPEAKQAFEEMVRTCSARNIKMIFTYAPEYKRGNEQCITNFREIMNYYKAVGAQYNIPLIRNDSLGLNNDPSLFANVGHLNSKGATIYSVIFARQIIENGWMK